MLVRTAIRPSPGSVLLLHLGSSSLPWLWGDPSTLFILLCLPSGCGHPFGSLVFFVTIDRQRRFPLEGFFFWVVASHFGVVSQFPYVLSQFVRAPGSWYQRFSLACHCPYQYPSSPGFFCCFVRCFGCVALLPYGYAHTCCWAGVFLCFLPALRPTSGSGYPGSIGFSSPLGFPTFAMGSPLRGRGLSVLDRNEGLVSPLRSGTLVRSWLDLPPLSAGICAPGPQGVLPGVRFTLALSGVLHGPWSGFSVASPTLAKGLGLYFVPYPLICRLGFVPRSVAQLCALQPLVPSFRVYLSEAAGFGGFLVLSMVLP